MHQKLEYKVLENSVIHRKSFIVFFHKKKSRRHYLHKHEQEIQLNLPIVSRINTHTGRRKWGSCFYVNIMSLQTWSAQCNFRVGGSDFIITKHQMNLRRQWNYVKSPENYISSLDLPSSWSCRLIFSSRYGWPVFWFSVTAFKVLISAASDNCFQLSMKMSWLQSHVVTHLVMCAAPEHV